MGRGGRVDEVVLLLLINTALAMRRRMASVYDFQFIHLFIRTYSLLLID